MSTPVEKVRGSFKPDVFGSDLCPALINLREISCSKSPLSSGIAALNPTIP
jgi:hypothetical protein